MLALRATKRMFPVARMLVCMSSRFERASAEARPTYLVMEERMRLIVRTGLAAAALAVVSGAAQARPEYARKENKPCAYCHVNPAGGGARNPRGVYYAMHNHTFEGYDEAKVMGNAGGGGGRKAGAPTLENTWRMDLPKAAARVAVSDTTDDKKPRLLVLGDDGKLTVYKMQKASIDKEAVIDVGMGVNNFVVGHFAKGKPAVIVVPGAVYYQSGDAYARKAAPELKGFVGSVRFADGTENVFAMAPNERPKTWAIDLNGGDVAVGGRDMPSPDAGSNVYSGMSSHMPPAVISSFGLPEEARKLGAIGLVDVGGKLYGWVPWMGEDARYIYLFDLADIHPGGGQLTPIAKTAKIDDKIMDVTLGPDPLGEGKRGLYVLNAIGQARNDRMVFFYEIQ